MALEITLTPEQAERVTALAAQMGMTVEKTVETLILEALRRDTQETPESSTQAVTELYEAQDNIPRANPPVKAPEQEKSI